jgi:hypothetical protein
MASPCPVDAGERPSTEKKRVKKQPVRLAHASFADNLPAVNAEQVADCAIQH